MRKHKLTVSSTTFLLMCSCTQSLDLQTANFVGNVQIATRNSCLILPTAQAITALANILFPASSTLASAIGTAEKICEGYLGKADGVAPAIRGNIAVFEVEGVEITAFIEQREE